MSQGGHTVSERERRLDEVLAAYLKAVDAGNNLDRQGWIKRYPEFAPELAEFFAGQDQIGRFADSTHDNAIAQEPTAVSFSPRLCPTRSKRESLHIGTVFAGQYQIFGIKSGGMGRVYLADVMPLKHGDAAGKVAIKTVADYEEWREAQNRRGANSDRAIYENILQRFQSEAETWVRLGKHDHILWAFHVIEVGGKPYIVMEYADRGDLRDWITGRRLTVALAINLAIQFCEGMAYVSKIAGLVHRDIKPGNILLTQDCLLRIADFGLSKAFDLSGGQGVAGTLAYMAPEQLAGVCGGDTRSDIFAFGTTVFEMLTFRHPFPAEDLASHLALRRTRIPLVHEIAVAVPPALSAIIARCLAFDPADRYGSFPELARELNHVHENLPGRLPIPKDDTVFPEDWQIVQESYSLLSLGHFDKAARRAQDGIELTPSNADHWINRGKALTELGDLDGSQDCYVRAIELQPKNALAWSNLGFARLCKGDAEAGLQAAQTAIQLDEELYEAWYCHGECELAMNRTHDAAVSLRHAINCRQHDWRAYPSLARALGQLRQFSESAEVLRSAVKIIPDNAELWLLLAVALGSQQQYLLEARQAADRALELDSSSSDAWAVRASILWDIEGPSETVRTHIRRSLEIDSNNPRAGRLIKMSDRAHSVQANEAR